MKTISRAILVGLLAASAGCAAPPASRAREAKQVAPDFTLHDTDGHSVALHDLLKRGPVILAFFPKAFTAG